MIPFLDLKAINAQYRDKLLAACTQVIDSGWYISGKEVEDFERKFADYCGTQYAIGVANGLDALILTLRAWKELGRLNEGDEVIVPSNTYIASILAISQNNLKPVLVEPDIHTFNIDAKKLKQLSPQKQRRFCLFTYMDSLLQCQKLWSLPRNIIYWSWRIQHKPMVLK